METNVETRGVEPVAAQAYRTLERMIVTLELGPGLVATEGSLIARLGLGRTPVREAVQRLAWEGLVEIRPRAGLVIASLSPGDWARVIDARRGVEAVLARSAARFVMPETAGRFHAAALSMRKSVMERDVLGFLDADKALDDAMAAAADNVFAARLAAPLRTHSRRFWYRYQRDAGLAESAERHVALISAILERRPDAAEAESNRLMTLLRAHAETAGRG